MAVTSRTNQAQRSGPASAANNLNIVAFNNLTTGETITLLVERAPFPVAIKPLHHLEPFRAGKFDGSEQCHHDGEWQMSASVRNQTNGKCSYR